MSVPHAARRCHVGPFGRTPSSGRRHAAANDHPVDPRRAPCDSGPKHVDGVRENGLRERRCNMRRRRIALPIVWLAACAVLAGADFWEEKELADWSDGDVRRMMSNSPWAKRITVVFSAGAAGGHRRLGTRRSARARRWRRFRRRWRRFRRRPAEPAHRPVAERAADAAGPRPRTHRRGRRHRLSGTAARRPESRRLLHRRLRPAPRVREEPRRAGGLGPPGTARETAHPVAPGRPPTRGRRPRPHVPVSPGRRHHPRGRGGRVRHGHRRDEHRAEVRARGHDGHTAGSNSSLAVRRPPRDRLPGPTRRRRSAARPARGRARPPPP